MTKKKKKKMSGWDSTKKAFTSLYFHCGPFKRKKI